MRSLNPERGAVGSSPGYSSVRDEPAGTFEPARLLALLGVGTVALAVWIGILLTVAPHRLLTYLAFFVPLWIFVACFGAGGLYWLAARAARTHLRTLANSVRLGCLVASLIVVNLSLAAAHRWTPVFFLASAAVAGVVEFSGRLAGWRSTADDAGQPAPNRYR